jgi:hypothetical protein
MKKQLLYLFIILSGSARIAEAQIPGSLGLSGYSGLNFDSRGSLIKNAYIWGISVSKNFWNENMFAAIHMSGNNAFSYRDTSGFLREVSVTGIRIAAGVNITEDKSRIFHGPVLGAFWGPVFLNQKTFPEYPNMVGVFMQLNGNYPKPLAGLNLGMFVRGNFSYLILNFEESSWKKTFGATCEFGLNIILKD